MTTWLAFAATGVAGCGTSKDNGDAGPADAALAANYTCPAPAPATFDVVGYARGK